jgi:hypothetical protein
MRRVKPPHSNSANLVRDAGAVRIRIRLPVGDEHNRIIFDPRALGMHSRTLAQPRMVTPLPLLAEREQATGDVIGRRRVL